MFFPTSAILLSVGLHVITSAALPAASRSSPLTVRDDDRCAPDTNFYVCYLNNFRGCCSVDPCAMEDGCPDDKPDDKSPPAPTCEKGKAKIYAPEMTSIDRSGTSEPGPTSDIHVINSSEKTIVQTVSFVLPSAAVGKSCGLNWSVPAEREFTVDGNGLMDIKQVITPNELVEIGAADFTNWPQVKGPHSHTGGFTDCEENLTFEVELREEGEVFLAQNEETGWYIEYEC